MDLIVKTFTRDNYKAMQACSEMFSDAKNRNSNNGFSLGGRSNIINTCDYFVCAFDEDKHLIGFLALAEEYLAEGDIYIAQALVDDKYQNKGVATELMKHLMTHSKGYKYVTAEVNFDNAASNKLFQKAGFEVFSDSGRYHCYAFDTRNIKNNKALVSTSKKR